MLNALGRREEALAATQEAVEILFPLFRRFPAPLAHNMRVMVQNYEKRSEEAGREPNTAMLEQISAVFDDLNRTS